MTGSGTRAALGVLMALMLGAVACTSTATPITSLSPTPSTSELFAQFHGWIVFTDERGTGGIWAINPEAPGDQRDPILLSPEPGWPVAWSSDGSRLLILRRNTERPSTQAFLGTNLFLLNADGTETRLTNGDAWVTGGSFSPDGSKVVYATGLGDERTRIYLVDASGGAPQVLLTASRRRTRFGRNLTALYLPTFSPDGSKIAYFDGMGDSDHNLMVMNADGSGSRDLLARFRRAGHIRSLVWSPDGTHLLFDSDWGIYTLAADGSRLTKVLPGGIRPQGSVSWSPDGSRIAYSRAHVLVIADADGSHAQTFGDARAGPWNPLG